MSTTDIFQIMLEQVDAWYPKVKPKEYDGYIIGQPTKTLNVGSIWPRVRSFPDKHKKWALLQDVPARCVYVIRDGDEVLYVGMTSVRIDNRLKGHLHDRKSPLGQAMKRDLESAHNWEADIYTMPDRATAYKAERVIAQALQPTMAGRRNRE